jgi:hypothetical protein
VPLFVLAGGELAVACLVALVVGWVLRSGGLARLREVWREEPPPLLPPTGPGRPWLHALPGGREAGGGWVAAPSHQPARRAARSRCSAGVPRNARSNIARLK